MTDSIHQSRNTHVLNPVAPEAMVRNCRDLEVVPGAVHHTLLLSDPDARAADDDTRARRITGFENSVPLSVCRVVWTIPTNEVALRAAEPAWCLSS